MKPTWCVLMVALAGCPGKGGGGEDDTVPPVVVQRKPIATHLAELSAAANCANGATPPRVWCIAADGWATGTAAELPTASRALVGVAVALIDEEPAEEMLESSVSLVALGLAGGKARIADIQPANAAEQKVIGEALGELAAVFKHKKDKAVLPAPLLDYLKDLPSAADHPLVKGDSGWTLDGAPSATELRKVGDVWVAIMIPPKEPYGAFVAIFTDKY